MDYEKIASLVLKKQHQEELERQEKKSWKEKLEKDSKGNVTSNINNYIAFLENYKDYKSELKYNEFLCRKEYKGEEFTDFILNNIYVKCEQETTLSSHTKIDTALEYVFDKNRFNPVLDYLNGLEWDGKKRIGNIFINLLDVDDTKLNYELTKKWFIAAVKRVFEPGCKFDNILVLQGSQGIGKSTICELIAKSFFNTISLSEVGNKDLVDKLNKTWIAIIDELDTFNKKEMSTIKTFLSLNSDSVRLSYARNTQTFKRHCVFIGSTNDDTFLRDSTSSVERRFWILKCNKETMDGKIRETLTTEYINQLWAEAVYYYKENPTQYLDVEKDLQKDFAITQREFKTFTDDIAIDYIRDILDKKYLLLNNECFNDLNDFVEQYRGSKFYDEGIKENLTKIPMSWVLHVLKDVYKIERNAKHVANALSEEWEYKTIKYGLRTFKGLYRKPAETVKNHNELEFNDL